VVDHATIHRWSVKMMPVLCLGLMKSHTSIGRNQLINKRDEINPKSI